MSVIKMSVMWDLSRPPGSVGSAIRWGRGGLLVAQVSCKRLYLIHYYIADVFVGKVIVLHHFAHIRWILAGWNTFVDKHLFLVINVSVSFKNNNKPYSWKVCQIGALSTILPRPWVFTLNMTTYIDEL